VPPKTSSGAEALVRVPTGSLGVGASATWIGNVTSVPPGPAIVSSCAPSTPSGMVNVTVAVPCSSVVSTICIVSSPVPSTCPPRLMVASPEVAPPVLNSIEDSWAVTCSPAAYASPSAGVERMAPTARCSVGGATGEFSPM